MQKNLLLSINIRKKQAYLQTQQEKKSKKTKLKIAKKAKKKQGIN